jgi:hypothetical protein
MDFHHICRVAWPVFGGLLLLCKRFCSVFDKNYWPYCTIMPYLHLIIIIHMTGLSFGLIDSLVAKLLVSVTSPSYRKMLGDYKSWNVKKRTHIIDWFWPRNLFICFSNSVAFCLRSASNRLRFSCSTVYFNRSWMQPPYPVIYSLLWV